MPKVKLIIINSGFSYNDYDEYSADIIRAGITDWEDITDKELEYLNINKYLLSRAFNLPSQMDIMILKQDDRPIIERISSLTSLIKKMEDDRVKEEEARLAKKAAAAESRRLKKLAKTEAEELALLATLKAKHES